MNRDQNVLDWVTAAEHRLGEADVFLGHGTDSCWDEAVVLVCHALGLDVNHSATAADRVVDEAEAVVINDLLTRRIEERLPAAYLTGEAVFAGLSFSVTPDVLIPRSPIAELIEEGFQPWLTSASPNVCDLCTGSGCIGIAIALHLPDATVVASDISIPALAVAQQNLSRHQTDGRVTLVESDLFDAIPAQQFDLIVSNPPYVAAEEWRVLPREYHVEPSLALLAEQDGLALVFRILERAADYLTETGILVIEVGSAQPALERYLPNFPGTWLEFERGGEGVFLIEASHLRSYQATLAHLLSEPL